MTSEEIKKAMVSFSPVIHKGIKYQRISAYIYRIFLNPNTGKWKETFQVELLDKNGQSVTIANAADVTLLEDNREGGENETF